MAVGSLLMHTGARPFSFVFSGVGHGLVCVCVCMFREHFLGALQYIEVVMFAANCLEFYALAAGAAGHTDAPGWNTLNVVLECLLFFGFEVGGHHT